MTLLTNVGVAIRIDAPPVRARSVIDPARAADSIANGIAINSPTMKAMIYTPEFANHAPHALLTYDPRTVGITPSQVQEKLRALRPRIELNGMTGSAARFGPHSNENTLVVSTWMMQPRDAEIVARCLHEVLS